jgi:hypothetical protein
VVDGHKNRIVFDLQELVIVSKKKSNYGLSEMFDWQPLRSADVILGVAALLGPIFAVQAQKWIEQWRAEKDRRVWIFRTLMATRATRLAPEHVEALNSIPLDFYGVKAVMDRWEEYFSRLSKEATSLEVWHAEAQRLFIALVTEIGKTIGYKFNAAEMERIYFPQGHQTLQNDQQLIQRGLALWLTGQLPVKMAVTEFPAPDRDTVAKQEAAQSAIVDWLEGKVPAPVEMIERNAKMAPKSGKAITANTRTG